jgi:hypothetical protein
MPFRKLIYLGSSASEPGEIRIEGEPVKSGHGVSLERRRSPWDPDRPVERIIVGSHPARADVLIDAAEIEPEHIRLYLPVDGGGKNDLKVIVDGTVEVNGRPVLHTEWCALENNDELRFGPWLFRFEDDS